MIIILGIESTCDETAISVIQEDSDGKISVLSNIISSQQKEHEIYGGVVPELASRSHLNNIRTVAKQALKEANINLSDINAIAAIHGPGLIGGLLVGNLFGKTLASVLKKPFIGINHLEAHILMPLMNSNNNTTYPFLAILISGGHSQIIFVNEFEQYKIIGKSLDDSVGETFDKVGLMLGMNYPAGPAIEKAALNGDERRFVFPMPLCTDEYKNSTDFSFSGLKTHVKLLVDNLKFNNKLDKQTIYDISASLQYTVLQILIKKISNSFQRLLKPIHNIIVSGGVSANLYLKSELTKYFSNYNLHFPELNLSTDNGVMIAWNGLLKYKKGYFNSLDDPVLSRIW